MSSAARPSPTEPQPSGAHLEVLASVASAMARSRDIFAAMDAALDALLPALGLDVGGVYVLDERSGELRAARARGVSPEYLKAVARFSRDEALLGSTLDGEAPVVVADLSGSAPAREAMRRLGVRSVVFVPLYAHGRAMGVMPVGSFDVREFAPDDLRLLSAVGGMLGLAIDNERLAEQSRRHLAEVRMLWEIDRALGEDRDRSATCWACSRARPPSSAAATRRWWWPRATETQVAAVQGLRAVEAMGSPPMLGGLPVASRLREGQPCVQRVDTADGGWHAALVGVQSTQRQVGLLVVRTAEWREPELGPLATLAQRAALAVAKARAREAEGRRASQLALLSAASEIAASTLDVDRLLDAIARYVQRSFGYYSVAIYLVDQEARTALLDGAAGAAASVMPQGHRMPFGAGIIGWVAEHGELRAGQRRPPRAALRARQDGRHRSRSWRCRCGSWARLVAVINVESDRLDAFDDGDVVALDGIAAQVASAIRNARLFEEKVRAAAQPGDPPGDHQRPEQRPGPRRAAGPHRPAQRGGGEAGADGGGAALRRGPPGGALQLRLPGGRRRWDASGWPSTRACPAACS